MLDLPASLKEFALTWKDSGIVLVGFRDAQSSAPTGAAQPKIYPPPRVEKELVLFSARRGWVAVTRVSSLADSLCISDNGSMAAFIVRLNHIPEEAERGEVFCCALNDEQTAHVKQLTSGAGRVNSVALAANGAYVLFDANFSAQQPITTHTELFVQSTRANETAERTLVVARPPGAALWHYAFTRSLDGALTSQLIVTFAAGAKLVSQQLVLEEGKPGAPTALAKPSTGQRFSPVSLQGGKLWCG